MADAFEVKVDSNVTLFASKFVDELDAGMAIGLLRSSDALKTQISKAVRERLNKHPTGQLSSPASWPTGVLKTDADGWHTKVFSMLPYARIQNEGGKIVPKNVNNLAIPNRNFGPVIRNQVGIAAKQNDPSRTKLRWIPSKAGAKASGYLIDIGADALAYTLMRSVPIRRTGYLEEAAEKALPEIILEIEAVVDAANAAAGG